MAPQTSQGPARGLWLLTGYRFPSACYCCCCLPLMLPTVPPTTAPTAAPVQPLPPAIAAIPAPAAAPIAAPLTVPCCWAVMFVHPSIANAASVVKANLILSISSLRHLFILSPGTTISNQMVSSTGRCNCSGCAPYHLSSDSRTLLKVRPIIPLAARGARLRPSGIGLSA